MGLEELLQDNGIVEETQNVDSDTPEQQPEQQIDSDVPPVSDSPAVDAKPETPETPPIEVEDPRRQEVKELRQMLRESKREMSAMKAQLSRTAQKPVLNEDGDEIPPELSRIELLQNEIGRLGAEKSAVLDVLVETMEMSPKYEDVRQVCTRAHFDDLFETAAVAVAKDSGKSYDEALLEVELSVWKMTNPYKYMYGMIKQHHPKFAAKPVQPAVQQKTAVKPAPPAPSSLSGMGGGDGDIKSGWTSSRIDSMDIDELDKVPKDIYDKYLLGTLK